MENTASFFAVPRVSIVEKEIVYLGQIHSTPLIGNSLINADKIRDLVEGEYLKAGVLPSELSTGAVIITGESARKENARAVLQSLSDLAGEFVVSTAGPDLEAIIAGKGSGAWQYSLDNNCLAANIDIGGGTSNIVLFNNGEIIAKGCVDIGGKQICFDRQMQITYLSKSAKLIADSCNIAISEGSKTSIEQLTIICAKMDELLCDLLKGDFSPLLSAIETKGSSKYLPGGNKPKVFFSGGVAAAIYTQQPDLLAYNDIGMILGQKIAKGLVADEYTICQGSETIRATVVGAGNYTTTISGSTIFYSADLFPFKNVPVLKLSPAEEQKCYADQGHWLAQKIQWFCRQCAQEQILLAIEGINNPSYEQLVQMAKTITLAAKAALPSNIPLLIAVKNDIAKALGQTINTMMADTHAVIVIDAVAVEHNDYIDLGKPLMEGLVIPVVVKTLIFA